MTNARLYRYFDDRRWAEAFVAGQLRFRTLAYFRDLEEQEAERLVRRDPNEGRGLCGCQLDNMLGALHTS